MSYSPFYLITFVIERFYAVNIVMFGHKSFPSRMGGIEIVVGELSTRMVLMGHSVTVYNRKDNGFNSDKRIYKGSYKGVKIVTVYTIKMKGLAALTSSFIASLKAGFGNFDVVHIHAEGPAFFCFIPKYFRKKVIVTIHGLDWKRAKWGKFASWFIRMGEKNAVKYADEIIVLSNSMKDYFLKRYYRETRFITNGVNKPILREAYEIKKWGLEKNNFILYLGRIVPEKGEHYLIEAFRGINTDRKLVIAGGVSDTEEYEIKLKELASGDNRIIFTGFVEGRILEELFSNAYIYCLPSDIEGMPLSLLEAMSYGNCCLISNIAECTEVVEDKAITFQKSSVKDLSAKLKVLLENSDIVEKYKREAAGFVCSKFTWDDVTKKTLELYR